MFNLANICQIWTNIYKNTNVFIFPPLQVPISQRECSGGDLIALMFTASPLSETDIGNMRRGAQIDDRGHFQILVRKWNANNNSTFEIGKALFSPPNGRHVNAKIVGGPPSFADLISLCWNILE